MRVEKHWIKLISGSHVVHDLGPTAKEQIEKMCDKNVTILIVTFTDIKGLKFSLTTFLSDLVAYIFLFLFSYMHTS